MKKVFFLFVFFLFFFSISFGVNVNINVNEHSHFEKLLNGNYKLIADGILKIENPSNFSKIYEFNIPVNLDALIGISKINLDNSSSKFSFNFDRIKGYIIEPKSTIKVGYRIFGILDYDVYNLSVYKNKTIFSYYTDGFELSSNLILNLQKPQREGYVYNDNNNHTISSRPGSNSNTTRFISASIKNPTDFSCDVDNLNLYRTTVGDPYFINGKIIDNKNNFSVNPYSSYKFDFIDHFSNDYSVYWLSSTAYVNYNLTYNYTYDYFLEKPTINNSINDTLNINLNKTTINNSNSDLFNNSDLVLESILIKKSTDKTLVTNGDKIKVSLQVVNINDYDIHNLTVFDEVPVGYDIINISSSVKINNGSGLIFNIDKLKKYGTNLIEYTLVNKVKLKGVTYLKPAKLEVLNKTFFSSGILIINDLLPNKKLFIQKEVTLYDDSYSKVTIKVKNLGNIKLNDLLVVDPIPNSTIIKDISKVFFQKGTWKIKTLNAGEEWEVSYLVEKNKNIGTLPSIFGVEKSDVYGTLISSGEVVTVYKEQPKTIEKFGIGIAVSLLIFYLLF